MASSVRNRTISASMPGTAGTASGGRGADDDAFEVDSAPPQAASSAVAAARAMAARLMARQRMTLLSSAVPRRRPGHDPASLHEHLELLLGVRGRSPARCTGLELERAAVPGADQARRPPDVLDRALVE